MSKKKLEVVELNKKEEKIILEEVQSPFLLFWKKYSSLFFSILLILSLTILIVSVFITVSNLSSSTTPTIKEVSIDTEFADALITINSSVPLTEETAQSIFKNNNIFKSSGEILVVKTIETGKYTIKFFSDYTAIKIMKNENLITRINSIDGNKYGIDETGTINSNAKTTDISKTTTKIYSWGTVEYYSDGTAEIINSKFDIFVRNAKDINENYISNNKVSYLKESKDIGGTELNYYYDGTIEVIKDNKSYLVRKETDLNITNKDITFKNNNAATIKQTIKLSDGKTIDYYTDGGAIIHDGSRTISIRKSNSIIIKDNKIYEIVDNIYVTVSKTENGGNIIYYTNGSAVIKDYNGKTIYVEENSDISYQDGKISDIGTHYEELTEQRDINGDKILKFESVAIVENNNYTAIVPKDSLLYNSDGSLKEISNKNVNLDTKPIKITNSTNEPLQYRLVIEKSNRTNLDIQYIRYQLSVANNYIGPERLDSKIWMNDKISNGLSIKGTNYILLERTLEPLATDEILLMMWTDYNTIPNSMQNKYFYGTIRVYAWKEIEQ